MPNTSISTCNEMGAATMLSNLFARVWRPSLVFCSLALFSTLAFAKSEPRSLAHTPQGSYEGAMVDDVHQFLGISYAETTAGANRWQPPKPLPPHDGLKSAKQVGPGCLQSAPKNKTSEDCLSLNVWTANPDGPPRPVVVWIHGGGLRAGSNDQQGQVLASPATQANPAVVVAINYRLGPLGFFAHRSLRTKYANFAVLDMIAALKWVQTNIEGFGGDPNNVTIAGVSAGGMAVNMLMTSKLSKGLFHKAIAQSGYGTWPLSHSRHSKYPAALDLDGAQLPSAERISSDLIKTITQQRQTRKTLYALSGQDLVEALDGFQLPYVDGATLKAEPGIRFAQNKQHKVPFITGGNSNEGSVMGSSGITSEDFARGFGADGPQLRKLYESDFNRDDRAGWARVFGDNRYLLAAQIQGQAMARSQPDTWLYYVDFIPASLKTKWIGTPHGADAWLLFNGHTSKDPSIKEFTDTMRAYWLNFARTGNPNGAAGALPEWPRYTPTDRQWLRLSERPSAQEDVIGEKLRLLTNRYELRTSLSR